ncbi:MAG: ricin-type beta-trefoil lectin domain protein [Gemmatimonadales bacterium]|nr:ricin-type beta-trefoil lectin domain protein [Gemmatimonadales bacterium]
MISIGRRTTALVVALGLAAAVVPSASAQTNVLVSRLGSKCLDAEGSTYRGVRMIGYSCAGGVNQQFSVRTDGTIRLNGWCLDDYGGQGRDGDMITLWDCNGGKGQQWTVRSGGAISGINGKCIDLKGGSGWWGISGNQPAILWPCSGADNQRWYLGLLLPAYKVTGGTSVAPGTLGSLNAAAFVGSTANIVAAGGGNIVAAGGGNIVATGGGNIVAAGGGNIILLAQ